VASDADETTMASRIIAESLVIIEAVMVVRLLLLAVTMTDTTAAVTGEVEAITETNDHSHHQRYMARSMVLREQLEDITTMQIVTMMILDDIARGLDPDLRCGVVDRGREVDHAAAVRPLRVGRLAAAAAEVRPPLGARDHIHPTTSRRYKVLEVLSASLP
jgi:hypothetical protein